MGGPSVSIGMEEFARIGIKKFEVGTTGSIQEKIKLGDVVINNAAVRLDGASRHYAPIEFPAVASLKLTNALVKQLARSKCLIMLVFLFRRTLLAWTGTL